MSVTAEKTLSKKCGENKPKGWMHERIENLCGNGTADLVLSKNSVSVWIELKCAGMPKSIDSPIDCSHIRKSQIQWHRKMRRAQCLTWCLIQVGKGASAYYCLFDSKHLEDLKAGAPWDWYQRHAKMYSKSLKTILSNVCLHTSAKSYHG